MPTSVPVAAVAPGNVYTSTLYNSALKDNMNKLLNTGHRVLTVAQFAALGAPEGTKGTVAPDEVYLEVDATNGVQWHLAYESGEATYKWRYLGGPPMVSLVATQESTASTTYADLATVGPSITVPRAGDFDCGIQGLLWGPVQITADIIGPGVTPNDLYAAISATGNPQGVRAEKRVTFTSSAAAKMQYKAASASTVLAQYRRFSLLPVRLI